MRDTDITAEKYQIEIFQRMLPETKLHLSIELTKTAIELVRAGIKHRHPEFNEHEVNEELKKILLTEKLFNRVYNQ